MRSKTCRLAYRMRRKTGPLSMSFGTHGTFPTGPSDTAVAVLCLSEGQHESQDNELSQQVARRHSAQNVFPAPTKRPCGLSLLGRRALQQHLERDGAAVRPGEEGRGVAPAAPAGLCSQLCVNLRLSPPRIAHALDEPKAEPEGCPRPASPVLVLGTCRVPVPLGHQAVNGHMLARDLCLLLSGGGRHPSERRKVTPSSLLVHVATRSDWKARVSGGGTLLAGRATSLEQLVPQRPGNHRPTGGSPRTGGAGPRGPAGDGDAPCPRRPHLWTAPRAWCRSASCRTGDPAPACRARPLHRPLQ